MGFLLRVSAFIIAVAVTAGRAAADIQVRDAHGNIVTLPRAAERIVSLAPHLTENLFAAGAGSKLVGTVQSSDYPPAAKRIPRVGGHTGLDLESIVTLDPDLVVAWASGNRRDEIGRLRRLGFTVYISEPRHLDDIPNEIEKLGKLAGSMPAARPSATHLRNHLRQLRRRYSSLRPVRVFYQLWHQPLMTINGEQIISRALALCGGRNIFAGLPALAPSVTVEAVLAADPEVIIASAPDGRRFRQWTREWRRWRQLTAVERNNIFSIAPDLLQRQGGRMLQGTALLCEAIAEARRKMGDER